MMCCWRSHCVLCSVSVACWRFAAGCCGGLAEQAHPSGSCCRAHPGCEIAAEAWRCTGKMSCHEHPGLSRQCISARGCLSSACGLFFALISAAVQSATAGMVKTEGTSIAAQRPLQGQPLTGVAWSQVAALQLHRRQIAIQHLPLDVYHQTASTCSLACWGASAKSNLG